MLEARIESAGHSGSSHPSSLQARAGKNLTVYNPKCGDNSTTIKGQWRSVVIPLSQTPWWLGWEPLPRRRRVEKLPNLERIFCLELGWKGVISLGGFYFRSKAFKCWLVSRQGSPRARGSYARSSEGHEPFPLIRKKVDQSSASRLGNRVS